MTRMRRAALLSLMLGAVLGREPVLAQSTAPSPAPPPRVAVVLSGGAAKGLAHVGVLRVLEAEGISPEIVTGTSMGAIIGALYAIGYAPDWLDSLVTNLDWTTYFRDAPEHRLLGLERRAEAERVLLEFPMEHGRVTLPSGAITGQRISELVARLTWPRQTEREFRRLPRAFSAVATDLETGETVVLDTGSLARAVRASMSIPSVFSPVRLGGRVLVDGGVTRNLPARDARALGADILICSDVSDPLFPASRLRSLLDVLFQTAAIYMNVSNDVERPLCDVYIRPDVTGSSVADFGHAAEWVRRGELAAAAVRPELRAVARRVRAEGRGPAPVLPAPVSAPVSIAAVRVEGATVAAHNAVRHALQLPVTGLLTAEQLGAATKRAYATELFDEVHYRLEAEGSDTVVVITLDARESDRVGLGLRYDDTWKASLLFTARLRNRIGFGSTSELELRLGEQLRLGARHYHVGFAGSPLTASASASYSRTPWPLFQGDQRLAEARLEVANATLGFGTALGHSAAAALELEREHAAAHTSGEVADTSLTWDYWSAALHVRRNTFDRPAFPTRGHGLSLRSEWALSTPRFRQHVASAEGALPVTRGLTAMGRLTVGRATPTSALPPHYRLMLGGSYPSPLFPESQVGFVGLRPQQRAGEAAVRAGAGLQWEARPAVFLTARVDVGYAGDELTLDRDAYGTGAGLSLGALTPIGPMELTLARSLDTGRGRIELNLGKVF